MRTQDDSTQPADTGADDGARAGGTRRARVSLRIPSQTSYLGLVRDVARCFAEAGGFDAVAAGQIALAVDEAATNAIVHAYGGAADAVVRLRFKDDGHRLRIDVVDEGERIDPNELPIVDVERYASEGRKGGLGVHLMGKIMDSVTFRRVAGRNVCCLVKRKETPVVPAR